MPSGQAGSRLGMGRPIHAFPDRQGLLKECLGAWKPPQLTIHFAQLTQRLGQTFPLWIEHLCFLASSHKGFLRMRVVAGTQGVITFLHG